MTTGYEDMLDDKLIERFTKAAQELGASVLDSEEGKSNRAIRKIWSIEDVLRARGRDSRMKLAALLDSRDRFVRYYAAYHLLGLIPERARPIIEWNAKFGFDALAGEAAMTLHNIDTGFYKPD